MTQQLLNFDFHADPEPTFHSDADSNSTSQMMRIHIRNTGTQCCGAKNISYGSGSPAPTSAPDSFLIQYTLKITFFILIIRIKTVTIYKNIFKSVINRKEPESQIRNFGSGYGKQFNFGSSALGCRLRLHNTAGKKIGFSLSVNLAPFSSFARLCSFLCIQYRYGISRNCLI
jgi:hypothetical protein